MVRFSRSIEQRKQIYSSKANSLGVVWCSYNERTNRLRVYRRLLTNRLHGKVAELCSGLRKSRSTEDLSNAPPSFLLTIIGLPSFLVRQKGTKFTIEGVNQSVDKRKRLLL